MFELQATYAFAPQRIASKKGILKLTVLTLCVGSIILEGIYYGNYEWKGDNVEIGRFRNFAQFGVVDAHRLTGYNLYMANQAFMAFICTVFIISLLQFLSFIFVLEFCPKNQNEWDKINKLVHRLNALLLLIGFICGVVGTVAYVDGCNNFTCILLRQQPNCSAWDGVFIACAGTHEARTISDRAKIYETFQVDGIVTSSLALVLTILNCFLNFLAPFTIFSE